MIRILVTGVGSLLGQGIIKSIKDSALNCQVIGTDAFPSAVGLYWVDKGYILPDILKPEINESTWVKSLINIIKNEKVDIVIPGLDFELPILARNKSLIEKQTGVDLLVSSEKVINIGNDKWETVKYLKNNGFHYPKSTLPETVGSFTKLHGFPLIVKPRFGHTSVNVFLVNNHKELNTALKTCDMPIIQEYLATAEQEYTCGATYMSNNIIQYNTAGYMG